MNSSTLVSLSLTEVLSVLAVILTTVGSLLGLVVVAYRVSHAFKERFDNAVIALEKSILVQFSMQDKTLALLQQSVTTNNQSIDGKLMQVAMDIRNLQKSYDHLERKQQEDRVLLARVMERSEVASPHHTSDEH
jgi:hypothetical protein